MAAITGVEVGPSKRLVDSAPIMASVVFCIATVAEEGSWYSREGDGLIATKIGYKKHFN